MVEEPARVLDRGADYDKRLNVIKNLFYDLILFGLLIG
jgi:hypothetical protein